MGFDLADAWGRLTNSGQYGDFGYGQKKGGEAPKYSEMVMSTMNPMDAWFGGNTQNKDMADKIENMRFDEANNQFITQAGINPLTNMDYQNQKDAGKSEEDARAQGAGPTKAVAGIIAALYGGGALGGGSAGTAGSSAGMTSADLLGTGSSLLDAGGSESLLSGTQAAGSEALAGTGTATGLEAGVDWGKMAKDAYDMFSNNSSSSKKESSDDGYTDKSLKEVQEQTVREDEERQRKAVLAQQARENIISSTKGNKPYQQYGSTPLKQAYGSVGKKYSGGF